MTEETQESLSALMDERDDLAERIAIQQVELQGVNVRIAAVVAPIAAEARVLRGKQYGVVDFVLDGVQVKQTIPKRVKWDADVLRGIWASIEAGGDDPTDYIKRAETLKVPEKDYGKFPDAVRTVFDRARTVEPGSPSLKLVRAVIHCPGK